jgi:hypothetical protein
LIPFFFPILPYLLFLLILPFLGLYISGTIQ